MIIPGLNDIPEHWLKAIKLKYGVTIEDLPSDGEREAGLSKVTDAAFVPGAERALIRCTIAGRPMVIFACSLPPAPAK